MDEGTPIACTLSAGQMADRIEEWRALFASGVTEMESTPRAARLRLHGTDATLLAAVSLAQREKECCAFFEFAVEVDAIDRWLVIGVPEGAEEVLTDFVSMLEATPG